MVIESPKVMQGWYALYLAILKNLSAEKSFALIESGKREFSIKVCGNRKMAEEIQRRHAEGMSVRQLVDYYGMSKSTVCRYLKKDLEENKPETNYQMELML